MSTLKYNNVINCLALDPSGARIREDAFFCKRTISGWKLTVVVVIPPIQLIRDEGIEECLMALFKSSRNLPTLFLKNHRLEHGLKENGLRPVLAAEYFINNRGQMQKEFISSKHARAIWIDHDNHEEKSICGNALTAVKMIHQNHPSGNILARKATRWDKYKLSSDQLLANLLCDLFSFTCRATCKTIGVPYYDIGIYYGDILVADQNNGRFHRPMRDVLALINLLNLHNKITGNHNFLFLEKDMFAALNSMHRMFPIEQQVA